MNKERTKFLERFINGLHLLQSDIAQGCRRESYSSSSSSSSSMSEMKHNNDICTFTVLGAFTKAMMDMELLTPKPEALFEGLEIISFLGKCYEKMYSPELRVLPTLGTALHLPMGDVV
ncbi:hypothetical protein BJX63DRAFT_208116 [Aspergillus granulosus]|uniref:Uncharacterized protein n=1 Tax=Aspergillus granulosus TaxID=176169 RepID=A0ABR4HGH6_9EURO